MRPNYLKNNDSIFLIAPSFGCTTYPYDERLKIAINRMSKNHQIYIGNNCYLDKGIVASNTAILRAKEFMDAYESSSNAIWSVGGGETMVEILPYIDFNRLTSLPPKWFIGYSDNTVLTYTLSTLLDLETVYGPCFPSFFDKEADETLNLLYGKQEFFGYEKYQSLSADKHDLSPIALDCKKIIQAYNYQDSIDGRIIGGCIDILITLCGTKYDKTKEYIERHKEEGIIFFLEACDLNALSFRRALFQLKEAGWFKYIKGFIFGRPLHIGEKTFGLDFNDVAIEMLKEFNVPILLDCDIGHLKPTIPIRCGAQAKVSYVSNNIKIKYID